MRRRVLAWFLAGGCMLAAGSVLAAPPGAPFGAPGVDGLRTVRGEVTRVNEARGTMTLKTREGDVELQLPPATVKGIRKGDRLTVRLGVHPGAGAAGVRSEAPGRGVAGAKSP